MDYIHQLSAYNAEEIANTCISVGLFEEAFEIYKKGDNHLAATNILVDHIVSIDRAQEYAERVELPEVWSKVAKAQLDGLRISDSIESYIRAQDPSNFAEVIEVATHAGKDDDLIKYLRMARKTLREPPIDTALAFCYARTNQLSELTDFLAGANVADVEASGDKAGEEGHHEAAKIFYTSISNWAKLATTLVHLGEYQAAVECARKANSIKVWKQVNEACVAKKEFRLAQICGLNLIVQAEELKDLIAQYERNGYFDELISLLEAGLGLERAHMGMFTELGIALSKYHPERVMEHLKLFWSRINIPRMIKACEEAALWPELIFLYCHYDEWDNAALAMMERAADAWEHHSFKDIIVKVANLEIYYKALTHYLNEQPSLLTDLLQVLTPRIDVNRVVRMFDKSENTPLIKPFLLNVQTQNKRDVNKAIHELLIDEQDHKTLRDSVENYDNYDPNDLAGRLERHELVFFRQIAANIYRKNKRWEKSIALSKQDKLFKDAIETAAMSGKSEVVEELLRYVSTTCPRTLKGTDQISVRRHWQPRMFRRHALQLLRLSSARCCHGTLMASRLERLHHALHDQFHEPTGSDHQSSQTRQRRPKSTGSQESERGGQHTHSRRLATDVDPRTCCCSPNAHAISPNERNHSSADGLSCFLECRGSLMSIQ